MGLFDFVKNQFIEVIEATDFQQDMIVFEFPVAGHEIKMGAQLIVREGQCAIFLNEGTLADVFGPGHYTLSTENMRSEERRVGKECRSRWSPYH